MKQPKDMTVAELKAWAKSTGINPAWIELYASWTELHDLYLAYYNSKLMCLADG